MWLIGYTPYMVDMVDHDISEYTWCLIDRIYSRYGGYGGSWYPDMVDMVDHDISEYTRSCYSTWGWRLSKDWPDMSSIPNEIHNLGGKGQ